MNIYAIITGLKRNAAKTKEMRMNTNNRHYIETYGVTVENLEQFIYLGATVSHTEETNEDIQRVLGMQKQHSIN